MTAIRGVLLVDLEPHVESGWIGEEGRRAVHAVLSSCPEGVAVRIHLGAATWLEPGVILQLADSCTSVGSLEVTGSDAEAVGRAVTCLRSMLGEAPS